MLKVWIEAMRLRTLPVSVSGVIAGIACAVFLGKFNAVPAVLCLLFAVLAQIASNVGNEYYDFKNGVDKQGREGFRRGGERQSFRTTPQSSSKNTAQGRIPGSKLHFCHSKGSFLIF